MVNKIISLFNKKLGNLHEAAYLLGLFALLSQILAVVRDRILAYHFGADRTLDIYYAAFRIPDLIYVSIASFVAVTILIPFLFEKFDTSKEEAEKFLGSVFSVFLVSIIGIAVIFFFLMPYLAHLVAPGFSAEATGKLTTLSRILLLSPILLGLSNLLGSVTQLHRKFFVFALGPVLYNAGIILGIIFFLPFFGLLGVVYGVVLGAFCHMAIQIPVVAQSGFRIKKVFSFTAIWKDRILLPPDIRRVIKQSLPRTISLSITQLVIFILISVASLLGAGSIAVFTFAYNLQSVPLAIIGMSYSVAAFPTLAAHFAGGKRVKFIAQMQTATRHILFWSLPATVLFIVLRAQIVRVLYGAGEFDWTDTRLVAAGLAIFAVSVAAQSLVLLYARGYYAAGNTRTPLLVNAASALVIITLAFVFIGLYQYVPIVRFFFEDLLRVSTLPGTVVLMLPFAFSIGMVLNASLLIYRFKKDFPMDFTSVKKSVREGLFASIFMGSVAYIFLNMLDDFFDLNTFFGIFFQGAIAGTLGIIAGVGLLWVLDNEEVKVVSNTLGKRFWKARPLGSSDEDLLD